MDIIHSSERDPDKRLGRLQEVNIDGGPSLQDIVHSMRSHLLTAEEPAADSELQSSNAGSRGVESEGSVIPGNKMDQVKNSVERNNDSILRLLNGQNSTSQNQRGLTEEEIAVFNKGVLSADDDDDVVSISSARLCTPFYEELRKKYPQAFLRKRNSLSSNLSETSSYYGGDTPRRILSTPRSERLRTTSRALEGELPPRPPGSSRSRRGPDIAHDVEGDLTISGVSRRGAKTGRLQGILKNSRQYSSTLSLQNDRVTRSSIDQQSTNLHRSDSNSSLKERLHNHQEAWKNLFSEGNSIISKLKRTSSIESIDSVQDGRDSRHPAGARSAGSGLPESGRRKETGSNSQSVSPRDGHKRPMNNGRSRRREAQAKRFASPDSSHDSAVDLDNTSVRSGNSAEIIKGNVGFSQSPSRGQSPSRPRTPKLRSQSRSSSPMIPNGCVHEDDNQVIQATNENELPGFTGHFHTRDSDTDSGIIQGARGHGSVSSNDDDTEATAHRARPGQKLSHIGKPPLRQRAPRGPDPSHGSQKQGPVKAIHSVPVSPSEELPPHTQCSTTESGQSNSRRLKGPRAHGKIYGDPGPPLPGRGSRSCSADRKRERVTFEDEIMDGDELTSDHRAGSQPVLNIPFIAPPPAFAGSTGDLSQIPVYDEYDMDYNSPRGYYNPAPASDHKLVFQGRSPPSVPSPTSDDLDQLRHVSSAAPMAVKQRDTVEPSMELHSASPVVVSTKQRNPRTKPPAYKPKTPKSAPNSVPAVHELPIPPPPNANPKSRPPALPADLNSSFSSEVAFFNGFLDDTHFDSKEKKKSKLPWKKNKGRYTPTKEIEKMQHMNNGLRPDSRTASWGSLNSDVPGAGVSAAKPPTAKKTKSASQPVAPPRRKHKGKVGKISIEHVDADRMSVYSGDGYEQIEPGRGHVAPVENTYEEVDVRQPGAHDDINANRSKDDIYAVVNKPPRPQKTTPSNNPAIANAYDSAIESIEAPQVPMRGYESDLAKHKDLSASQTSLSERLGSFRDSAKKRFNQLRKSLSLEKLDRSGKDDNKDTISISSIGSDRSGRFKKSPSLRSFSEALGIRSKKKADADQDVPPSHRRPPRPQVLSGRRNISSGEAVEQPTNFRSLGKVRQLNSDGTQIVELTRPPHGPFGFYIARGNEKYKHAIFVSRLSDGLPESFFVGLLGVGDEIIEINGVTLRELPLDAVYDLMKGNDILVLKILPYVVRMEK